MPLYLCLGTRFKMNLKKTGYLQQAMHFGSTRRGIAYAYSDKYRKKTLRLADLLHLDNENVKARLKTILDAKNLELAGCYHQEPMSYPALLSWCEKQADIFRDYICDTGIFLNNALADNKKSSS